MDPDPRVIPTYFFSCQGKTKEKQANKIRIKIFLSFSCAFMIERQQKEAIFQELSGAAVWSGLIYKKSEIKAGKQKYCTALDL